MFKTYEEFQYFVNNNGIRIIDFKEIDLAGRWHHLSIPVERFTPALLKKGIGFDGSSYGYMTVEKSDMVFIPDLSSAFVDPVTELPTISMIGDIYTLKDGKSGENRIRFENDPRYIAEKAENFMNNSGITDRCLFGPEFEFYILDNVEYRVEMHNIEAHLDSMQAHWNTINSPYDIADNNGGYKVKSHGGYHVDLPYDSSYHLRNRIVRVLEDNGIPVKYHHPENGGPGQVEIEVEFATLREMGDRTQKLKYVVKNMALKEGRTATFMPKPFFGEAGSGMHVHFQMFKGATPVFYDQNGYSCLSETALYAIGGILKHAAALLAFTNPTTNSYRRLVPGYEAPVTICYATANRSSVIRIPGYATAPEDKRFEFRPSDAMANPYFAYSAIAMAAMDGILHKIDPVKEDFGPYDKNMYTLSEEEKKRIKALPKNLDEAIVAIEGDYEFLLAGGVFTKSIIDNQVKKLKKDCEEVNLVPHPIEFQKYFDI